MRVHSDEAMIKEVMWENHAIEEGIRKYKEALQDKSTDETKGGMRLLQEAMPNMIEGLTAAYKDAETILMTPKAGNQPNWTFLIGLVKAEQTAAITIQKAMSHIQVPQLGTKETRQNHKGEGKQEVSLTYAARQIGQALRQQLMFENWKKAEKDKLKEHNATADEDHQYSKSFAELLISRNKGQITRPKLARWKAKFDTYSNIEWGDDEVVIGMKLIEILVATNPDMFAYSMPTVRGKKTRMLTLTETAWATVSSCNESAELQTPSLLPTLIKPREWHYEDGKLVGGYHFIPQSLFSSKLNKHTAADSGAASERFIASLNAVQETAWSINPYILAVVDLIVGKGETLGKIPQVCKLIAPQMTSDEYNALSKEARQEHRKERGDALDKMATQRGRHSAFVRKLAVAHKMLPHERFYFPHFADFRGRLYPMAQELTPQGDKIAKGLLQFADGKPLGVSGLYWLKVHAANTFGKDKDSLADRVAWVDDNLDMMADSVIEPLDNHGWCAAEEPLTFLAAARELTAAYELADPTQFVSKIAVAMDGTCNGMQLLSLLGRDNLGAEKTNCRHFDKRFDLYSEVATKVLEICNKEKGVNEVAAEWFKKLHNNPSLARKTVKRAVMTTPYGVTGRGIADQLINDKHCHDLGSVARSTASAYMKDCILEAMSEVNGKAVEIMAYFQDTAGVLAQEQTPLSWYTPMGLKVTQAYNQMADTRIQTVFGTVTLWNEDRGMGLDTQKQFQSAAPNVIHSFDAAMLQRTVEKLAEAGHCDFAMIHDSYGMHAGSVGELHTTLREAAYEIFSADNLAEFHEYVQSQTEVQLPKPPAQGDYDMAEILNAPYFFS